MQLYDCSSPSSVRVCSTNRGRGTAGKSCLNLQLPIMEEDQHVIVFIGGNISSDTRNNYSMKRVTSFLCSYLKAIKFRKTKCHDIHLPWNPLSPPPSSLLMFTSRVITPFNHRDITLWTLAHPLGIGIVYCCVISHTCCTQQDLPV